MAHEFSHPEEIYLKEIAKRIEKYPVSKRILACEGFNTYLDSLEKFSKTQGERGGTYDKVQTLTEENYIAAFISAYT